jgi:hypothetical protein
MLRLAARSDEGAMIAAVARRSRGRYVLRVSSTPAEGTSR